MPVDLEGRLACELVPYSSSGTGGSSLSVSAGGVSMGAGSRFRSEMKVSDEALERKDLSSIVGRQWGGALGYKGSISHASFVEQIEPG